MLNENCREKLKNEIETEKSKIVESTGKRNSCYFDEKMIKLENWANDLKGSLELELKELDREIGIKKSEARKILTLENKVKHSVK